MRVEPLAREHLERIEAQPGQREWLSRGDFDLSILTRPPNQAWCLVDSGVALACAGLIDQGWGRALAWAVISPAATGMRFVALHKAVAAALKASPFRRVEIATDSKFQQARRWAQMLGFEHEGVMRAFCQDGDADRWAYIDG